MGIGIDFGTSNSAVVRDGRHRLDNKDEQPMPSLVAIEPITGEIKVGESVRSERYDLVNNGWQVIQSVKTSLSHDDPLAICEGKKLNSTHIATIIFKELKKRAIQHFGVHTGDEAIITIPVGLRSDVRKRLHIAAENAGIKVLQFISEPTAAFLSCRDQFPECNRVVVFDWGGGTLDVSVLQIRGDSVLEINKTSLGVAGDRIDWKIASYLHAQATGEELSEALKSKYPKQLDMLLVQAEIAKCTLAGQEETKVTLLNYFGQDRIVNFNRSIMEKLTQPIIDQCVAEVSNAIYSATEKAGPSKLDRIVMVGGSSSLWGMKKALETTFEDVDVYSARSPEWVIAEGASVLAQEMTQGQRTSLYRLNHPVYLRLSDNSLLSLVREGDPFDNQFRGHSLAIIEPSQYAQLVFSLPVADKAGILSSRSAALDEDFISVPMMGFTGECLRVEAKLTSNLTLEVRAQTEKSPLGRKDQWTTWEYEKLLFSYELPRRH